MHLFFQRIQLYLAQYYSFCKLSKSSLKERTKRSKLADNSPKNEADGILLI